MALPLFAGLEAGLVAMMLFEPVRGIARRAQYPFVDYAAQDPIHLLTPIVTLVAFILLLRSRRVEILIATPLRQDTAAQFDIGRAVGSFVLFYQALSSTHKFPNLKTCQTSNLN